MLNLTIFQLISIKSTFMIVRKIYKKLSTRTIFYLRKTHNFISLNVTVGTFIDITAHLRNLFQHQPSVRESFSDFAH